VPPEPVLEARLLLSEPAPRGYPLGQHAFCKINLGLRVGSRRPDGYHDVDTVLQTVDLADSIYARPRARGFDLRVIRRGPARRFGFGIPKGRKNLVLRAARLAQEALGETRGASLALVKRVPAGSGLGGGSSDAVAALRVLARLWRRPLSAERGEQWARTLGSDCAFFWNGGRARATGRGDRLRRLPVRKRGRVLIAFSSRGVSTSHAYEWLDKSRSEDKSPIRGPKDLTVRNRLHNIHALHVYGLRERPYRPFLENDLEEVIERHYPETNAARQLLIEAGIWIARMSGSGSAVFGILPPRFDSRGVVTRLRQGRFDVVMARFTRFGSLRCR
jgi:4-diphosphocytidyl-2-C-methyl-D-erythritol kinase